VKRIANQATITATTAAIDRKTSSWLRTTARSGDIPEHWPNQRCGHLIPRPLVGTGDLFAIRKNGRVALQRMDNVGIVVESLDAAVSFFAELGLELEGRAMIEGDWSGRVTGLAVKQRPIQSRQRAAHRSSKPHPAWARAKKTEQHAPTAGRPSAREFGSCPVLSFGATRAPAPAQAGP
jgi:hypothetical protein